MRQAYIPLVLTYLSIQIMSAAGLGARAQADPITAARTYRQAGQAVTPVSDTTILCEAEEFQVTSPGWVAKPWGENYYAATLANTFLSRKAFLGAPEQCDRSVASINVQVPRAGRYLALVRYEAAYRFETQFRLQVEQDGKTLLDRPYGGRDNLKIWAFGAKLKKEHAWSWGAVENVVWEGHDAYVNLKAGTARLSLVADKQTGNAARRNVDLVMLTTDEAQVKMRIDKENYLPLDGMLTQSDDVYLKLHNDPNSTALTLTVPNGIEHSPYWVHIRNWNPKTLSAVPGQSTDWVEVGSLLDSLNDGQWRFTAKGTGAIRYDLEFGVKTAGGAIESFQRFDHLTGDVSLAYEADTRYSRRLRTTEDVLYDLVAYLKSHPVHGTAPRKTLIYAYAFFKSRPGDAKYQAAGAEFIRLMGTTALHGGGMEEIPDQGSLIRGYVDLRGKSARELEEFGRKLKAEGKADRVAVVSLGDEIGLSSPPAGDQSGFHAWLRGQNLKPSDVDLAAGDDWGKVRYNGNDDTARTRPALFYLSRRYAQHYGIRAQKALTDALRKDLPNAGIGANYSPQGTAPYLGETAAWVTLFREGGMTMPWSEDYIWQMPVGSQQMNFLALDLFRAGIRGQPDAKIHFYVMPHTPGNSPQSWRRQFYGDLGHGMKIINLFEFQPVQLAYTENHTSHPEMFQEVRSSLHELGQFEDIVQDGQVRPGLAGLWFSETGDIWNDNRHPFDAAKRALYIAIRHQQLPLDCVVEADALDGTLKTSRVLYLADAHVSRAASKAIAEWVAAGGRLFATAGAGMFDEFNGPNTVLRELLSVEAGTPETPEPANVAFIKQDLPFSQPLDMATWRAAEGAARLPVIAARGRFAVKRADVLGTFDDGSPAIAVKVTGKGRAIYCGFLPGLAYFKPAIPLRPMDRGSADDSMAHFIPTHFDAAAGKLVGLLAADLTRPVLCSEPLVESTLLEAKQGVVIPLVNWSGRAIKGLTVKVVTPLPGKSVGLASGKPVRADARDGQRVFTLDLDVADALMLR